MRYFYHWLAYTIIIIVYVTVNGFNPGVMSYIVQKINYDHPGEKDFLM